MASRVAVRDVVIPVREEAGAEAPSFSYRLCGKITCCPGAGSGATAMLLTGVGVVVSGSLGSYWAVALFGASFFAMIKSQYSVARATAQFDRSIADFKSGVGHFSAEREKLSEQVVKQQQLELQGQKDIEERGRQLVLLQKSCEDLERQLQELTQNNSDLKQEIERLAESEMKYKTLNQSLTSKVAIFAESAGLFGDAARRLSRTGHELQGVAPALGSEVASLDREFDTNLQDFGEILTQAGQQIQRWKSLQGEATEQVRQLSESEEKIQRDGDRFAEENRQLRGEIASLGQTIQELTKELKDLRQKQSGDGSLISALERVSKRLKPDEGSGNGATN